jgi:WhiB family redox-sensing transcriptional regulator
MSEAQDSDRRLARDPDWLELAACASVNPENFTSPFGVNGVARAKAVCLRCPVRVTCLEFALASDQSFGIWGGLTDGERAKLRAARARPAP